MLGAVDSHRSQQFVASAHPRIGSQLLGELLLHPALTPTTLKSSSRVGFRTVSLPVPCFFVFKAVILSLPLSFSLFLNVPDWMDFPFNVSLYFISLFFFYHYRWAWPARGGACKVVEVRCLHNVLFQLHIHVRYQIVLGEDLSHIDRKESKCPKPWKIKSCSGLVDLFCSGWFHPSEVIMLMSHPQGTIWKKQRDPVWHQETPQPCLPQWCVFFRITLSVKSGLKPGSTDEWAESAHMCPPQVHSSSQTSWTLRTWRRLWSTTTSAGWFTTRPCCRLWERATSRWPRRSTSRVRARPLLWRSDSLRVRCDRIIEPDTYAQPLSLRRSP